MYIQAAIAETSLGPGEGTIGSNFEVTEEPYMGQNGIGDVKLIIGKHVHSHWMGECSNGHTLSSSLHARNIQERLCKSHIVPFVFVINFFLIEVFASIVAGSVTYQRGRWKQ